MKFSSPLGHTEPPGHGGLVPRRLVVAHHQYRRLLPDRAHDRIGELEVVRHQGRTWARQSLGCGGSGMEPVVVVQWPAPGAG